MSYIVQAKNSGNYLILVREGYSWTPHIEDATQFLVREIAEEEINKRTELNIDSVVIFHL